jgi:hypothetical protein
MIITGHGFDPGISYADDRFRQILVRETDGFEEGTGSRPVSAFSDDSTAMLAGERHWMPPRFMPFFLAFPDYDE